MNVLRLVAGIIVIVLGAVMVADGVLDWATGTALFYPGVNPAFKFVVGFIALVLASAIIPDSRK